MEAEVVTEQPTPIPETDQSSTNVPPQNQVTVGTKFISQFRHI